MVECYNLIICLLSEEEQRNPCTHSLLGSEAATQTFHLVAPFPGSWEAEVTVPCSPPPCLILCHRPSTKLFSLICFPGRTAWVLLLSGTEKENHFCTLSCYLTALRSMYARGRDENGAQPELHTLFEKRAHHGFIKHAIIRFCFVLWCFHNSF